MELIKQIAADLLHHERGAVFLTAFGMRQAIWDYFPNKMKDWLNNALKVGPFEPQQSFGCNGDSGQIPTVLESCKAHQRGKQ